MTTYIYRLPSLVKPLGSTLYLFSQLRSFGSVGDRYTNYKDYSKKLVVFIAFLVAAFIIYLVHLIYS